MNAKPDIRPETRRTRFSGNLDPTRFVALTRTYLGLGPE